MFSSRHLYRLTAWKKSGFQYCSLSTQLVASVRSSVLTGTCCSAAQPARRASIGASRASLLSSN